MSNESALFHVSDIIVSVHMRMRLREPPRAFRSFHTMFHTFFGTPCPSALNRTPFARGGARAHNAMDDSSSACPLRLFEGRL